MPHWKLTLAYDGRPTCDPPAGRQCPRYYDTGLEGVDGIEPVTMDVVFQVLDDNVARTRELLFNAIPAIATERHCRCHEGLAQGPVDSL